MTNADHDAEQASEREGQDRENALRDPQHFYPRPEDVLADASLSRGDKIDLLRNWQTQLEDRGGALRDPAHRPDSADDVERAICAALQHLGADRD